MASSPCYLFKNAFEYWAIKDIDKLPPLLRGIYVLYEKQEGEITAMNVRYVGMARGDASGAKGRLKQHKKDLAKADRWTHFSVFEVWDNITNEQVVELEGLFRHLYRRDTVANALNKQKAYAPLTAITRKSPAARLVTKSSLES